MAQISLRIEDDVKKMAEQACADIGMSLSTAINIYLKKLGREKRIPFEVAVDPFYWCYPRLHRRYYAHIPLA